jgi:hypothetical protein
VTVYAIHPRIGRGWALWASLAAAVLVPWLAELAGVVSQTTFITERGIALHMSAEHLDAELITVALALYTLVILAVATALSRALARNRAALQHSLHVQAWQLRQLVPRSGVVAESFVTMPRVTRIGSTGY